MVALAFVTLLLAALAIGAPLAHVLEMPVRRTYDPALYVTVTYTLYRYFGIVGAVIEMGTVVTAVIWAFALGRSRTSPTSARRWAITGAACLVLAHALAAFAAWTPAAVRVDWTRLRDQWEFSHAARGGLFLLGFSAFLASVLEIRPVVEGRGKTTG